MDCDALRDDQWERLREIFVPGATGSEVHARTMSQFPQRAALDGALGSPLARSPHPSGRCGTHFKRRYYRWIKEMVGHILEALSGRSGMADDQLDHRARPSALPPAPTGRKGGLMLGPRALPRRFEHQDPVRRRRVG